MAPPISTATGVQEAPEQIASPNKPRPSGNATEASAACEHRVFTSGFPTGMRRYDVNATMLEDIFSRSSPGSPTRQGSNAKVSRWLFDGTRLAVKRYHLYDEAGSMTEREYVEALRFTLAELEAAQRASALTHVVQYRGVILQEVIISDGGRYLTPVYVVMDWVEGQTLEHLFSTGHYRGHRRRANFARVVAVNLLRAVAELHFVGLVHNDLSAKNIMVDEHGNVTIVDLGECYSCLGDALGTRAATSWVAAAPDRESTPAKDVFSVALLVGRFLNSMLLHPMTVFDDADIKQRRPNLRHVAERARRELSIEFAALSALIEACSVADGLHRPSARAALELVDPNAHTMFMFSRAVTLERLRTTRDKLAEAGLVPDAKDVRISSNCQPGDVARQLLWKLIQSVQASPRSTTGTAKCATICHNLATIILQCCDNFESNAFAYEAMGIMLWRMHGEAHRRQCIDAFTEAARCLRELQRTDRSTRFPFRLAMIDAYIATNAADVEALVTARGRVQVNVAVAHSCERQRGCFQVAFGLFMCDIFYSAVLRRQAGSMGLPDNERHAKFQQAYTVGRGLERRMAEGEIQSTLRMQAIMNVNLAAMCTDLALALQGKHYWDQAAWYTQQAVMYCGVQCYGRGIAVAKSPLVIWCAMKGEYASALRHAAEIRQVLDDAGEDNVPERAAYDNNEVLIRVASGTMTRAEGAAELREIASSLIAAYPQQTTVHRRIHANADLLHCRDNDARPCRFEPLNPADLVPQMEFITWVCS
jgi:hypothetical protein